MLSIGSSQYALTKPGGGLGHGEAAEAAGCPDNKELHAPKLLPGPASTQKNYPSPVIR